MLWWRQKTLKFKNTNYKTTFIEDSGDRTSKCESFWSKIINQTLPSDNALEENSIFQIKTWAVVVFNQASIYPLPASFCYFYLILKVKTSRDTHTVSCHILHNISYIIFRNFNPHKNRASKSGRYRWKVPEGTAGKSWTVKATKRTSFM